MTGERDTSPLTTADLLQKIGDRSIAKFFIGKFFGFNLIELFATCPQYQSGSWRDVEMAVITQFAKTSKADLSENASEEWRQLYDFFDNAAIWIDSCPLATRQAAAAQFEKKKQSAALQ